MSGSPPINVDSAINFVTDLYADSKVVFVGDSNHINPAFKTFLNQSMKGMKEAGVTDLFLEIPREFQEHADAFFDAPAGSKAESMALARFATARGMGAEQTALIYEAKKQGIRTHFMDLELTDAETKAYDTVVRLQRDPKHRTEGRFSYDLLSQSDKKLYDPAFETLFAQREKVNEYWAKKVAEVQKLRPNGKFIVMGGATHADRKFIPGKTEKDVNELLEEYVGKTSYVRLESSLDDSIRILTGSDIPAPRFDTIETPLAVIRLPADSVLKEMRQRDVETKGKVPDVPPLLPDIMKVRLDDLLALRSLGSEAPVVKKLADKNKQPVDMVVFKLNPDPPLAKGLPKDAAKRVAEAIDEVLKKNEAVTGIKAADLDYYYYDTGEIAFPTDVLARMDKERSGKLFEGLSKIAPDLRAAASNVMETLRDEDVLAVQEEERRNEEYRTQMAALLGVGREELVIKDGYLSFDAGSYEKAATLSSELIGIRNDALKNAYGLPADKAGLKLPIQFDESRKSNTLVQFDIASLARFDAEPAPEGKAKKTVAEILAPQSDKMKAAVGKTKERADLPPQPEAPPLPDKEKEKRFADMAEEFAVTTGLREKFGDKLKVSLSEKGFEVEIDKAACDALPKPAKDGLDSALFQTMSQSGSKFITMGSRLGAKKTISIGTLEGTTEADIRAFLTKLNGMKPIEQNVALQLDGLVLFEREKANSKALADALGSDGGGNSYSISGTTRNATASIWLKGTQNSEDVAAELNALMRTELKFSRDVFSAPKGGKPEGKLIEFDQNLAFEYDKAKEPGAFLREIERLKPKIQDIAANATERKALRERASLNAKAFSALIPSESSVSDSASLVLRMRDGQSADDVVAKLKPLLDKEFPGAALVSVIDERPNASMFIRSVKVDLAAIEAYDKAKGEPGAFRKKLEALKADVGNALAGPVPGETPPPAPADDKDRTYAKIAEDLTIASGLRARFGSKAKVSVSDDGIRVSVDKAAMASLPLKYRDEALSGMGTLMLASFGALEPSPITSGFSTGRSDKNEVLTFTYSKDMTPAKLRAATDELMKLDGSKRDIAAPAMANAEAKFKDERARTYQSALYTAMGMPEQAGSYLLAANKGQIFLMLKPGQKPEELAAKLSPLFKRQFGPETDFIKVAESPGNPSVKMLMLDADAISAYEAAKGDGTFKAGLMAAQADIKASVDNKLVKAPPERGIGDAVSDNLGMGLGGIIGALIGWFVGGPIGVAIGALLLGGAGALAVDGEKGLLGGLIGGTAESKMNPKLKGAVTEYARMRFTNLETGVVDEKKVEAFVKRYDSMVAKNMTPEEQNKRADEIIAKTAFIKNRFVEADTSAPNMQRAMEQAKAAMAEIEQGVSNPAELSGLNFTPAQVKKGAQTFR